MPEKIKLARHVADIYARDEFANVQIIIEQAQLGQNGKPVFERFILPSEPTIFRSTRWVSVLEQGEARGDREYHEDWPGLVGFLLKFGPVPYVIGGFWSTMIGLFPYIVYWMPAEYTHEPLAALCFVRDGHCSPTHTKYRRDARALVSFQ